MRKDRYARDFAEFMEKEENRGTWVDALVLAVTITVGIALSLLIMAVFVD